MHALGWSLGAVRRHRLLKVGDSLMLGRDQVSDSSAATWRGHRGTTGRWLSTENKVRLCVLLENKLHLQDVSREKAARRT